MDNWGHIPLVPRFNVPETFGKALSYEGQIHAICDRFDEITDAYNDTLEYINSNFPWTFANPINWSDEREYPAYQVVYDANTFASYVSLQQVPVGVPLTDTEYWARTADYNGQIRSEYVRRFETVSDMQSANDLAGGMICHTNGFHMSGDGGAAYYTIVTSDTANGMDVLSCANSLYASLVITGPYVTPEMFGAYGDGIHDDTSVLNYIFSSYDIAVYSSGNKNYLATNTITVRRRISINFNLSKITFRTNSNGFVINVIDTSLISHERFAPVIENIIIDGGNSAICFYVEVGYKSTIRNIYINNFNNVGMRKDVGYEMVINNIWFWASNTATKAIGLYAYGNDCEYGAIFGINCNIGVKMRGGGNHFSFIHFWLLNDHDIIDGTTMYDDCCTIEISGNDRYHIDYIYFDTARYGIKYNGYGYVFISSALSLMADASAFVTDFATKPTYLIYADAEHLPYLRRIFINNFYATGSSLIDQNINYVIPEGYSSQPIHINNAVFNRNTINDNLPIDFIDQFVIHNGEIVTGHAVITGDRTLHLQAIVKQTDSSTKWSISYPNWCTPYVVNLVVPTTVNTNQYFTGTSTNASINIGVSVIGPLSDLTVDGYYYIDTDLKISRAI